MKNLFSVLILSLLFMASVSAQTDSVKVGKNMIPVKSAGYSIDVEGESFPIFETKSGAQCIVVKSAKTGNNYGVWICDPQPGEPKTSTNRISNKTKKEAVLTLSKSSGNPYMKWDRSK